MLKAPAQRGRDTRQRIVEAAVETLRRHGYSGTSARAVARAGGFNQALIFYHFGSLNDLLLAAVDHVSQARMGRYKSAIASSQGSVELMRAVARLFREDVEEGTTTVLSELVAASLNVTGLGPELVRRMEPWTELIERVFRQLLEDTPLEDQANPRDLAQAVIAICIGVEVLTHLDRDLDRVDGLFQLGTQMAVLFQTAFPKGGQL